MENFNVSNSRLCRIFISDSPIVKKEEQYIVLAIAVANALFCMIIIIKAVHVFVGLVSFVSVAMMLIGTMI